MNSILIESTDYYTELSLIKDFYCPYCSKYIHHTKKNLFIKQHLNSQEHLENTYFHHILKNNS